jgi:hypothetical protein
MAPKLVSVRTLVIEGTVDLPDGTIVDFDLQHSGFLPRSGPNRKIH